MDIVYENVTLRQKDFLTKDISNIETINCLIENSDFSENIFTNCSFNNCNFSGCNLSLSKLKEVQLNNVKFENCKILGVDFSQCTGFLFQVNFYNCILDFCSFENKKMAGTIFSNTSMKGIDFSGTNLQKSVFNKVDLQDAIFSRTNLKESDFSTATNFNISPNQNYIKKSIFNENNLSGLLSEFDLNII